MSPTRLRVVAALIEDPERPDAYLIQQRPAGRRHALMWEFPGGKVEAGESDADALRREAREELGVEVSVFEPVWSTRHAYDGFEVELTVYRASIAAGTPSCLDAAALRFATAGEMTALPFCEADVPFVRLLAEGRS